MTQRPQTILPLRLEGLSFAPAGIGLLADISLTIRPGRRVVVIGPNGAGKSLLLRLCHGLIRPTAGRVLWATGVERPPEQAMVFQHPVLLRRSVRANLAYPLALAGLGRAARRGHVEAALSRFGLHALADRPARLLSGGEQQRLAMARAWLIRPQVMFLDEPSSALDPAGTLAVEAMMMEFSVEGMALVLTTHDLRQARLIAQDVVFLHRGRLLEARPAEDFFEAPNTPEARAFLAGELVW